MNIVRKTAIPLAIIVALGIQLFAFAEYWITEPFIMVIWYSPLFIIIVLFTIVWSAGAVFADRGVKRLVPLALVMGSLTLASNVPYVDLGSDIDFKLKQRTMTKVALEAQQGVLPYDVIRSHELESGGAFTEYELPETQRWLVEGNSIFTSDVECGKYVFFPTFYGIPDGVGGFLFLPECAEPEQFPGGWFGAKWFGVRRLEDHWFRIDGT